MSKQSFVYGAFILLAASVFNRAVGFIYQMAMMRLIKPEGVGLFNMAFPIYVMVLVVASMGIPVAVAKLVAEEVAKNNLPGAYRIFKISFSAILISSLLITISLVLAVPLLQQYIFPNPKVYYCFISLVPGVMIVSLCSAFRGFFQGLQRMTPTAVTQAVEQLVRVTAGLSIAWLMLPRGVEYAAIGISLGVICGELVGFIFMLWIYLTRRPRLVLAHRRSPHEPIFQSAGRIFELGIPVTLARFVSTAIMSLEAILIPSRLQAAGMSLDLATDTFGQFMGIAQTLLFTPGVVTIAMATALVPAISDALAQGNIRIVHSRIEEAVRLTALTGIPMVSVFLILPRELCQSLFGYVSAATPLMIMALSGPFIYLNQTVTGILQGLGKPSVPFKNLVISSAVKITAIYYLTSVSYLNINGTAFALAFSFIIMSCLNYRDLRKITGFRMDVITCLIKPAAAALGCAAVLWQAKLFLQLLTGPGGLSLLGSLTAGGLAYLMILYLIGGINRNDLTRIKDLIRR